MSESKTPPASERCACSHDGQDHDPACPLAPAPEKDERCARCEHCYHSDDECGQPLTRHTFCGCHGPAFVATAPEKDERCPCGHPDCTQAAPAPEKDGGEDILEDLKGYDAPSHADPEMLMGDIGRAIAEIAALRARVAELERVIAILAYAHNDGLTIYDSQQWLLPEGIELRVYRDEEKQATRWKASVR